jgi:hypothetical protein
MSDWPDVYMAKSEHDTALAAKDAEIERLKSNRDAWMARVKQETDTIAIRDARIAQLESDNKALAAEADGLEGACKVLGRSLHDQLRSADLRTEIDVAEITGSKAHPEVVESSVTVAAKAIESMKAVHTHPLAPKYVQPRKETQE